MFGSLFKKKYNVDPQKLSLIEIQKMAIKKVNFLEYGKGLISKNGNVFDNKKYYDIDSTFDKKLHFYGF
jgi:hypothetical protein